MTPPPIFSRFPWYLFIHVHVLLLGLVLYTVYFMTVCGVTVEAFQTTYNPSFFHCNTNTYVCTRRTVHTTNVQQRKLCCDTTSTYSLLSVAKDSRILDTTTTTKKKSSKQKTHKTKSTSSKPSRKGIKGVAAKTISSGSSSVKTQQKKDLVKRSKRKISTANEKLSTGDKKKTKKKKKVSKIFHWRDEEDVALLDVTDGSRPNLVRFAVRGNPLPLRRHRTSRGFIYNPSAVSQASFQNITRQILDSIAPSSLRTNNNGTMPAESMSSLSLPLPLFQEGQAVQMSILFRMKRPNNHFTSSKRGPGRIRDVAPSETSPTRTDVDNLAKFVLDSMNGILYYDDHQVCSLHVTKLLDNNGSCEGSTEIYCTPLNQGDVPPLVDKLFPPLSNNKS